MVCACVSSSYLTTIVVIINSTTDEVFCCAGVKPIAFLPHAAIGPSRASALLARIVNVSEEIVFVSRCELYGGFVVTLRWWWVVVVIQVEALFI